MKELNPCLLIDNDEDDREIFLLALEKANPNIECTAVASGIQALELLRKHADFLPAFIFIDMNMPLMDGRECLHGIRQIGRLKDVSIYMYSTTADPKTIESLKGLGITDFLIKPSKFNELISMLARVTDAQHA